MSAPLDRSPDERDYGRGLGPRRRVASGPTKAATPQQNVALVVDRRAWPVDDPSIVRRAHEHRRRTGSIAEAAFAHASSFPQILLVRPELRSAPDSGRSGPPGSDTHCALHSRYAARSRRKLAGALSIELTIRDRFLGTEPIQEHPHRFTAARLSPTLRRRQRLQRGSPVRHSCADFGARATRPFAAGWRTTPMPFLDCAQRWVKPRTSNVVGDAIRRRPYGRLRRKSTWRVLVSWSVGLNRPRRLPGTSSNRLTLWRSSTPMTKSSANSGVHSPLWCHVLFHESEYWRGLHRVAIADVARCEFFLAAPGTVAEAPMELRRPGEFSGRPVCMRTRASHDFSQATVAEASRRDGLERFNGLAPDRHRQYFVCMPCT